jgi:Domain of unknown function (DUF4345)
MLRSLTGFGKSAPRGDACDTKERLKMTFHSEEGSRAFGARRSLQAVVAIFALIPVLAGLAGVLLGPGMVDSPGATSVAMDSHYRYLSGLLMGIGLCFWTTIPGIETKTARFQLLTAIVFLGGLGRLDSFITVGVPDRVMLIGLAMELIVTPLLALCQGAVARQALH